MEWAYPALLLLTGMVIGCTITWLLSKKREILICEKTKAEADIEKAVIQSRLSSRENELSEYKNRFDKTEQFLSEKEEQNLQFQKKICRENW